MAAIFVMLHETFHHFSIRFYIKFVFFGQILSEVFENYGHIHAYGTGSCRNIDKGQSTVIIYINNIELESLMPSFKIIGGLVLVKNFKGFYL